MKKYITASVGADVAFASICHGSNIAAGGSARHQPSIQHRRRWIGMSSAIDPTSPQVDRHVISEIFESMTRFPDIWRSLETIGRLSGRDVLVRCASNLWSEYRFANNTHTYKHDKMVSYKSDCVKAVALVQQAECVYVFLKRTPGIRNWNP